MILIDLIANIALLVLMAPINLIYPIVLVALITQYYIDCIDCPDYHDALISGLLHGFYVGYMWLLYDICG